MEPGKCWRILRRDQRKIAERILENLSASRASVLAANTGWGKTITVLCPTLSFIEFEEGRRAWFFVHRRDQIAVPVVKHLLEFFPDKTYSFLYSKIDMCPLADANLSFIEFEEICNPGRCPYRPAPPDAVDPRSFGTRVFDVVKHLAGSGFCPYYTLRALTRHVDVIVLHHVYLFVKEWRESLGIDLENDVVVIDEFHGVEDVLDTYSVAVDNVVIRRALREAERVGAPYLRGTTEMIKRLLKRYRGQKNIILRREHLGLRDPRIIKNEVDRILEEYRETRKRVKKTALAAVRIAAFAEAVWGRGYDVFVEEDSLVARPVDPGEIIGPVLDKVSRLVLVSATPPRHEYMRLVWNVQRGDIDVIRVSQRWGHGVAFKVPWVTTRYTERGEEVWRRYAYLIDMLIEAVPGVHLYVFPAYHVLTAVYGYVENKDVVVVEDRSGTRITDILEAVQKGRRAVFAVARGKLVEGVEIKQGGESLVKLVCLCGIPYPEPDIRFQRLVELVARRTGVTPEEATRVILHNIALTASIQALGRAVRSKNDYAFYVLADKRFTWRMIEEIASTGLFDPRKIRVIPLPSDVTSK